MPSVRIETDGLTLKETLELKILIDSQEGVEGTSFEPFSGGIERRSFPPQAGLAIFHIMVHLAKHALELAEAYAVKKAVESVLDKGWDGMKARFNGKSSVEVSVRLYGADGELLKEHRGKR